ncbi:hypothetical protein AB0J71_08305 [Nonomuraea sp. NPDC049637]|uniref:hypothetical protein n=1 Tax=Nonomuraea sp. NPDC049637 TaxID=3154356 RepID=UPI003416F2C2
MDNVDIDIAEQFGTGAWKFPPGVAEVFDDHVPASMPHYDAIQALVAGMTDWLVPATGLVAPAAPTFAQLGLFAATT